MEFSITTVIVIDYYCLYQNTVWYKQHLAFFVRP